MKIIVDGDDLLLVANTIKELPVRGGFSVADRWVGCVIALQKIVETANEYVEPVKEEHIEESRSDEDTQEE